MVRGQLEAHEECVEHLLSKLRRAMLGCMVPCLPEPVSTRSEQRRAIRTVAERLTLCFAVANAPVSAATLQACRSRLYAMVTYLYFECRRADQTFDSLLRLTELDTDIFAQMVARARHTPRCFLRHYRRIAEVDGNNTGSVLDALTRALHKAFPASQIHPEEVTQGLHGGDFIVLLLLDDQRAQNQNLYARRPTFDVLYHPKAGRRDCIATGGALFSVLEYIALEDGDLLRGTGMTYEVVDSVLHFKVTYRNHVRRDRKDDTMESLAVKLEG